MEYYAPTTLKEAERLKKRIKGAVFMGGGTVLNWRGSPRGSAVIDLRNLGLRGVKADKSSLRIGALVTISEVAEEKRLPLPIRKAASWFMSVNVRNAATVGGSVTGNFHVSNLLPVFAAFRAELDYYSTGTKRSMPIAEWISKKPGIITSIVIRDLGRTVLVEQDKIAGIDFPMVVSSLGFSLSRNRVKDPVVAVSGAAARFLISRRAAAYLKDRSPSEISWEELSAEVQKDLRPTSSVKATGRVRRKMVESQLKTMVEGIRR